MPATKQVSDAELAAVTALPAARRYAHLVAQCADWNAIWSLHTTEGWVSAQGDGDTLAFPVWPHAAYAKHCAVEAWHGAEPRSLSVDDFLRTFAPGLASDGSQIAAFPTPSGAVTLVSVTQFVEDLRAELDRME